MGWLYTHPYASAVVATLILLLSGAFIVERSAPVSSSAPRTIAWEGTGAAPSSISYGSSGADDYQNKQTIMQQVQSTAPYTYAFPAPITDSVSGTQTGGVFDFESFLKTLSGISGGAPSAETPTSQGSSEVRAYSFIPSGLIAASTPSSARSPSQTVLYEYGNEVGSLIQSFDSLHLNKANVLRDQVEDRTDPAKAAALEGLGNDLSDLGKTMLAMESVPASFAAAHSALAKSYVEIGGNLAAVPKAQSDADFITAILKYNTSADTFIARYVALAQLFGAYGVTFSESDPGSVFSFTPMSL